MRTKEELRAMSQARVRRWIERNPEKARLAAIERSRRYRAKPEFRLAVELRKAERQKAKDERSEQRKEGYRRRSRAWQKLNPEKCKAMKARWYKTEKGKALKARSARRRRQRLTDWYVKVTLGMPCAPEGLIQAKRIQLKLLREAKRHEKRQ